MDRMPGRGPASLRRRWPVFGLIVLLALCLSLAGCGNQGKKENGNILRFYTWKPNQPEVWEEIVKIFEAEHPGVKVWREIGPHSSTSFHDLLAQKLKNRSKDLDVFLMDVVWPAEFAAAGWALALDDRFRKADRSRFFANTIQANTYGGKIYGVPLYIDAGMLYYRRDLLAKHHFKPPETWPELVRQAAVITAGERGIYGFSGQFKQYEGLVCNMMEYVMANKGCLVNPRQGKPGLAEPPAREAVLFVRDHLIGNAAPPGRSHTRSRNLWPSLSRARRYSIVTGPMPGRRPTIPPAPAWPARPASPPCPPFPAEKAMPPWGAGNWGSALIRRTRTWPGTSSGSSPATESRSTWP